MNCQEFKTWIAEKELFDEKTAGDANNHMSTCGHCQKLYSVDAMLEGRIGRSLGEVEPPATMLSRIETDLLSTDKDAVGRSAKWKLIAPPLAMAALVLIALVNPFSGQIRNIQDLGALALENHLDEDMTMKFKAGEISNVSGWFAKRLGYDIPIPDFRAQGATFLGGRKCTLGKKKAAYLSYSKKGKRCSLFITNASGLNLEMEPKKIYPVENSEHTIKVWRNDSLVYASIE